MALPTRRRASQDESDARTETWSTDDIEKSERIAIPTDRNIELLQSNSSIAGARADDTIGHLTAHDLMTHHWQDWAHLDPIIYQLTELIRTLLSENNQSERILDARTKGGQDYRKMILQIESMILKELNKDGVNGQQSNYYVERHEKPILIARVINEIMGLGPIEPLYAEENITEIMANGPYDIQVEIKGRLYKVPGVRFRNNEHLFSMCSSMLSSVGRSIDVKKPVADGRLPDKSRINVTHSVIGDGKTNLTLRRHPNTSWTIKDMVNISAMNEEIAQELAFLIYHGCSTIIIGGTGSGKTSMLNALSGAIPSDERLLTIEDSMELKLNPRRTVVPFETREASSSGEGAVTIRMLVKNALRMRPDRIIVGEVRDATAYDMLDAMNTGHDGSMTTVHANDAYAAVDRLSALVTRSGDIDPSSVNSLIAGAVDLFVVIGRFHEDGSRRVTGIYEIPSRPIWDKEMGISTLKPIPLWEWQHTHTSEDGTVIGEYQKINDPSPSLTKKKRLDTAHRLSIEEVYELSDHGSSSSPNANH